MEQGVHYVSLASSCSLCPETTVLLPVLDCDWLFHCRPISDIHSVLEITVYDEDKDMKKEFIGKVAIPLMTVGYNMKLQPFLF